jgi:hypothetical protein
MQRWARINFVLVAVFLLVLGKLPLLPSLAEGAPEEKVTICHFPPGNPSNVHQITVGASAVPAHVTNHGDAVCADGASNCCFESGSSPSVCTSFASDVNNCGSCGHACIPGQLCSSGSCVCPTGTALCGSACVNEQTDNNNCGACGNVCVTGTACKGGSCQCTTPGTTLCAGTCVNEQNDVNNCGACGHVCTASQTCVAGACSESCLPTSSLSVLIQGTDVTAYVPKGDWASGIAGVDVVRIEGAAMLPTTVATGVVNSCSSCSSAACGGGVTVCTGNSNDVYRIAPPATLSASPTANATRTQAFSGGFCQTCGVAIDAATGNAWIEEGRAPAGGQLEPYRPSSNTFGPVIGLFGQQTSENISVDPVRKLILSPVENNQFQIIDSSSGAVYNAPAPFVTGGELDAVAEDCRTGVAVASVEDGNPPSIQKLLLVNLSGATFTAGSPGTWTAPTNLQDFSPDFVNLNFGTNGVAVAPGSNLAVVAGEFSGTAGFGVVQLPATVTPTTIPAATDWVSANVPTSITPACGAWQMGRDPHTVTAYRSPNDGKAYALMTNASRTCLVKIDMAQLLSAPRNPGTHTANPALIPAGTFTFIAE